ncbi:DUF262 domain-containing protein [Salmonella enterica subsp. enterica serovar Alachua]|uniref:DUF262 domain-containing protein n=3 Tax=Citrobacter freundii complex TaxID=1344959 RepID=UPI0010780419|nr:DUF262 domain-containing HNH endonuclease family protein [Citrobacter freundii]EAA9185624.1 DUF262 domain-containing protein [Salmonella enterica]ECB6622336.1 DUF262 domain-containing protein [Salmonella enterica subsp. enterica serovar Alachua]ECJ7240062.1 DUF262 domain-containing protein [Salmonella enterica]MDK2369838.1 DUF262 domain-containing HNH endonuclease family protein [Citrobacter freundii]
MNFDATPLNIKNILSVKQRYVIPRNQREFSWEKLQLDELWQDIIRNIKINSKGDAFEFNEYFIGTIVLSGADSDDVLEVVDGQQRFSVITILLSLISRLLRKNGQEEFADDIFKTYIVTANQTFNRNSVSSGGDSVVEKLSKNSDRAFFKLKFQDKLEHKACVTCDEDKKILYAGLYLSRKLGKKALCSSLLRDGADKYKKEDYLFCLHAVYNMVTNYLKLVRISVGKEDDAYDIFEVLNARGINLSSIDLIKNKVFQSCVETYPVDKAKEKWDYITSCIEARDSNSTMVDYVRCWWLSKFNYIGEDQLYRAFKRELNEGVSGLTATSFLDELHKDVDLYCKIISPDVDDWPQQDQRGIFNSLKAFEIFNVSIPRPFILSLLRKRRDKSRSLSQKSLIECLACLERFHFRFNAICRLRPSGIDAKYSVLAVSLDKAANKRSVDLTINDAVSYFSTKSPNEKIFNEAFIKNLFYTNKKASQRKLIMYIFERFEKGLRGTNELKLDLVSLEHIGAQSSFDSEVVGLMGNLLPLCFTLNESCKNDDLSKKIPEYKKSNLRLVNEFIDEVSTDGGVWNPQKVKDRTLSMSARAYNLI